MSLSTHQKLDMPLHQLMELSTIEVDESAKQAANNGETKQGSNNNDAKPGSNNNNDNNSYGKTDGNRRGGRNGNGNGRGRGVYTRGRGGYPRGGRGSNTRGRGSNTRGRGSGNANGQRRNYDNSGDGSRILKISAESNPKTVAGAISHISRQGECPSMLATGALSVNQAIKALAIARSYLENDDIEINCYPSAQRETRNGIFFTLTKTSRRQTPEVEVKEMKVSASSNPGIVAGAVAIKLREGQRVSVTAMGADSVLHGVQAISMGRKYVEENGLDISFRPEFTKVRLEDGEDRSAIKFLVIAQQI